MITFSRQNTRLISTNYNSAAKILDLSLLYALHPTISHLLLLLYTHTQKILIIIIIT